MSGLDSMSAMFKVNTYESFQHLPQGYLPLFDQWMGRSFFYGTAWFRNLVENALGEGDRVRIYGLEPNDGSGAPFAALPTSYPVARRALWRPRKLTSLTNYYTSLFGPVLSDSGLPAQEVLRRLARAIANDTPRWDVVDLKPLDVDSPLFAALLDSFRAAGMVVQAYFCFGNWYYPVNGRTYQQYLESLRSSVRNIAKSKNKKIERSGRVRVEIVTGGSGLESAIQTYEQVYASSWKVPEPHPHFVPGLIRTCAKMGWLRLGLAYADGEPAAAQLWIVNNGVASIYKIAYDRRFSDLSVGTYLTMRLMEQVIDVDRVREVDYLSGDDRYKSDWMSDRRERWGIMAFNPRTVRGFLAMLRHVGGRALKNALRRRQAGQGQAGTVRPEDAVGQAAAGRSTNRQAV